MASVRWGGLRLEPYNPDAVDADNDGIVQEGTAWERPAGTRLLDELGNEVERGFQSMQRPTLRVVDRDGNTIDYKPTYQRGTPGGGLRKQQKLSTLGELGYPSLKEMGVRSIGDMVPTIGDIVRPKQKVVDVEGSVFNIKRKITPDRIIPKRGNRQRAFNRADEKAKELAFMQGDHYLVETDSEFLILSPNEFDNFFDEVNGPDGMPSGLAISKYEKPRPKQADDAAIRADLLGPREMEIDDAAYRDALFDIHYNYGNPAFLDDDLFIPVVFDENLEMGGSELLNPDGSQTTFEDIMTGVRKLEYGEEFENRRFKFRQLKSEFLQSDSHGGLWSVFQVTDKETGEVWYVKGSTYPANDAVMELLGMRAGSLLDLAARPDGRNIRISPQATVRIVGDRSVRWTAMRNVGEWNHPDGEILAWVDGHEGGGLDPDKVDVGDMAQILAMDFIFGNTDRHTGNLMIATDANGRQRLAIIDNGILAGGRLHSEKDQFGFDLSVKDITDRLEAEASKQPDEIFNDPSGNYLVHDPAFKTMNARLGDIDGDGGEFIDATQRTVQAIKENLDALFDLREYSRRGVPLTPAERAHLEGVKKVALARIEMLEKDPDLIWYQAWSPIPGQIQAPQGNIPGNAPDLNSPNKADISSPIVDFDEPIELAELRGQIDSIDKDLLTGIQEALGTDSEELVQTLIPPRTDSDAILSRSFSDGWYEAAEEKIRDSDIADSEKEKLLTLLDDARVSDELKDISPYLTELIPFADPLGGDFVFQPAAAPYDTEEARQKYQDAFSRLSQERRDLIVKRMAVAKEERKQQDQIQERERFRQQARFKAEAAVQDEINKAKQKFIQKPGETRKYDAPVGEALTGVRERNGSDIEYDPDSVRPVEQIQTDADSVLVKAADLSLPEHEEELVDFLISDELSDIADELEAPYDPHTDVTKMREKPHDILARLLIKRRGFDGDAMKVTSSELDQLIGEGYREMTRGGSRRPQDEFISGEMLIGTGVDGAGLYFATETFDPTAVPPGWGHFDASTYARDASDGAVIRGVMNPSAQYLDIEDVRQELDQYGRAMAGQFPTPKNSRLADLRRRLEARAERGDKKAARSLKTLDAILTARDGENNPAVSAAALLLGADAVQDLGLNNRSIIYNRSAIITGDALLTPDENDALKGFEQFKARHNQKLIADGRLPLDPTPEQVKQWTDAEVERMLEEFDRLAADSV